MTKKRRRRDYIPGFSLADLQSSNAEDNVVTTSSRALQGTAAASSSSSQVSSDMLTQQHNQNTTSDEPVQGPLAILARRDDAAVVHRSQRASKARAIEASNGEEGLQEAVAALLQIALTADTRAQVALCTEWWEKLLQPPPVSAVAFTGAAGHRLRLRHRSLKVRGLV